MDPIRGLGGPSFHCGTQVLGVSRCVPGGAQRTVFRMEYKTPEAGDGERVKAALDNAGLSERRASERTGIPLTSLNRKLRGLTPFTATDLRKLGHLLGVPASTLLAEEVAA